MSNKFTVYILNKPIPWVPINAGDTPLKAIFVLGTLDSYLHDAQIVRFPLPRKRKSEARMSKEWRGRA